MKRIVYAGSFDPVHLGHVDVIRRGAALAGELVVAIGHNPAKRRMLSLEQRLALLREVVAPYENVRVDHFEGLTVDYCLRSGADAMLRALRDTADFAFESQIAQANRQMAPAIETIFLLAEPALACVSSSLMKEIAAAGGDPSRWLPAASWEAIRRRPGTD